MITNIHNSLKMHSLPTSNWKHLDRKRIADNSRNKHLSFEIGMALLSVSSHLQQNRYCEGPQRMFEKIYAFNLSWLNKNIHANLVSFQDPQDILDLLMVQLKVYEQYAYGQKSEPKKCEQIVSSETRMWHYSTFLAIVLFFSSILFAVELFRLYNFQRILPVEPIRHLSAQLYHTLDSVNHDDKFEINTATVGVALEDNLAILMKILNQILLGDYIIETVFLTIYALVIKGDWKKVPNELQHGLNCLPDEVSASFSLDVHNRLDLVKTAYPNITVRQGGYSQIDILGNSEPQTRHPIMYLPFIGKNWRELLMHAIEDL